ncbi:hypothetical protein RJ55_04989 [Drechmeria coniospora]|nr:hypothetical protein RJ55_04989 [Drechmeria coniospora]
MSSFDFGNMAQQDDGGHDGAKMTSPQSPVQQEGAHYPHPRSHPHPHPHPHHHTGNVTVYQTSGPDAHVGPIVAPGGSGAPQLNPRSCVTCRRRKVRCDKQMPCSNCRRALIPCVFPAPGRAPRQQRAKDPNAPAKNTSQREVELIKRLRKLEGIVEELSGQIEVESSGKQASSASSPVTGHPRQTPDSLDILAAGSPIPKQAEVANGQDGDAKKMQLNFGRMVLDDTRGTSRYVSSGFWSKLNDELDSIREETQRLTDETDDDSDYEGTPSHSPAAGVASVNHNAFVLGYRSADVNLRKYHPLPSHATFLWSVYQENVEPLIKVLHVPTTELILRDARRNSEKLTPGNEALAFAVYFSAITSLEPDEIETNFSCNKVDLVAHYRFALEQSLAKANFLDTSDIAVVQAFVLFLIVVRRYDESRFCWALTGLLIRIAQGLGLHRDGSHFNLSAYETETRRRLWHNILMLDLRSAEELGTDMTIDDRAHDTRMPSNLNDADFGPESTESPVPREGRSDCAVALVRTEICTLARRLVRASSAMTSLCPKVDEASIAERERMLIEVYQRVEHKFLQHVLDDTDPLYWVAAMISRVIMAKMCLVIYQPMLFPGSDHELSGEIRQRIYVAAIEVIEYNHKLNTDPRCKQYRWLFRTYTNWHAIAYTLIETCRRPWTPLVERGWEAVNGYDKNPVEIARRADHAAVFLPLRRLFARARRHRDSEIARLKADQEEARRLDFAERMNPAQARFGPVPGTENRMEQVRDKWWALTRPDGEEAALSGQPPPSVPAMNPHPQEAKPSDSVPIEMDFPRETMQYMDDLVSQPNFNMAALWNVASGPTDAGGVASASASVAPTFQNLSMEQTLRLQAVTLQTQSPKDDNMPPFLWSDPFTVMNTKLDDPVEDTDMLGDDFNWLDWSQTVRGVELESTQQDKAW